MHNYIFLGKYLFEYFNFINFLDLKKLIKYDLQQRSLSSNNIEKHEGPERLHSASTFSSRSRSKAFTGKSLCCTKGRERPRQPLMLRNIQSAPALGQKIEEKHPQRACSCVRIERKTECIKESSKPATTLSDNCNIFLISKLILNINSIMIFLFMFQLSKYLKCKRKRNVTQ